MLRYSLGCAEHVFDKRSLLSDPVRANRFAFGVSHLFALREKWVF
jgi:hypothetical protein